MTLDFDEMNTLSILLDDLDFFYTCQIKDMKPCKEYTNMITLAKRQIETRDLQKRIEEEMIEN